MPNVSGSNGNDILIGTANADRFAPLLGYDWVDGGAGRDTLLVNYGAIAGAGYSYASVGSSGGSFGGYVQSGDGQNAVSFQNIERLDFTLDSGDSIFYIDGSALAFGATVDVDAGGGFDVLEANFSALIGVSFEVGPNGKVKLGNSSFSNFENYYLTFGAGADRVVLGAHDDIVFAGGGDDLVDGRGGNDLVYGGAGNDLIFGGSGNDTLAGDGGTNTLFGGDGDDQFISQGGVDAIDGGDGYDYCQSEYLFNTENMSFFYNGSSGAVSNGSVLSSIEQVAFFSSAGDDVFTISGAVHTPEGASGVILRSGAGHDTLSVNLADNEIGRDFIAVHQEGASFSGVAGAVSFNDFEDATFTGEDGDATTLVLSFESDLQVAVQADGTLATNVGITLSNYDSFSLQLGGGNDVVVAGAGRDTVRGMGGDDIISGGLGGDNLYGGEGADTFVYNSLADTGQGSGRVDGILDFSSEEGDRIDFRDVVAGEFSFIGSGAFSGSGVAELRTEDLGNGFFNVHGDLDGDGVADFRIVVQPDQELTAIDFFL